MRYLVLSDIHSNLEALEAVLSAAAAQNYDAVLVLGDLVGYGADPNAVVDRVRALRSPSHRCGATTTRWRPVSMTPRTSIRWRGAAARWTRNALTKSTLASIFDDLPIGPVIVDDDIEICHGSPLDEDLYVVADVDATRSIAAAQRALCLFGHTHVALCAKLDSQRRFEIEMPQGHPEFQTVLDR